MCLVSLVGEIANVLQFISPSIFDSMFSASIFPRRTSNLSNSSIGEFGGLY